jgi:hypothetical protein
VSSYVYAYSIDEGSTWIELPPTLDTHITVTGLPVATTVLFRWWTLLDGVDGASSPGLPYQVTSSRILRAGEHDLPNTSLLARAHFRKAARVIHAKSLEPVVGSRASGVASHATWVALHGT